MDLGRAIRAAVLAAPVAAGLAAPAEAAFTFTILEQGGDVVVTGSGTLNLSGLNPGGGGPVPALIKGSAAGLTTAGDITIYDLVSGPASFGSGDELAATSSFGDVVYLDGAAAIIGVPQGYVSGAALSNGMTFAGASFASLGLTPGTYVWSWGGQTFGDTLTVQIGAAVPEPASLLLLGAGLIGLAATRRRRPGATA
ncbi:PEP-CTERM sorting domain-containing protein [Roseomonas sp. AR75]|uniref:PEP-CTERM sorting domain-containing protein n=1 Tax=Roseomonas sp. AR75 TaxID=2562311 RepID=UPI0010C1225E|nr:PEP-CTERM sorting domain-containing protein [Roseomonas sp. AR75]